MTRRFGQGIDVDRARPHLFHRDYWILRVLREEFDRFLADHKDELRGATVLDYGAGDSPYSEILHEQGIKLLSADIPPVTGDVLPIDEHGRVPLDDASVDAIFSTQVMEHVADVGGYLREAARLLKPGKPFLCTTHGAFILHRCPTDYRRWTIDGLRYELEQAGFIVEEIRCRIGILAAATHLRSITLGGLTRRIPATGWLRPLIYFFANCRMGIEDWMTPKSVMESNPELLIAIARRPK